jgi:hypothetical protein
VTATHEIDQLRDIADAYEARVYEGYSGRGMFGKTCWGISCSRSDANDVIAAAGECGIYGARTDSLGTGTIVYWPSLEWKAE